MGIYTEYIDRRMNAGELQAERKRQLRRISQIRGGRDILVYAAALEKGGPPLNAPISIDTSDILPITDQLANLHGNALDFILETPGGLGEVAEDIVRLIRHKYERVAVIVPGTAKSAGTIMAMAGDEILMEPASSLGPIDAQISWQGKVFSAHALVEKFKKIYKEAGETGKLNKAWVPILGGVSPGELEHAENTLKFSVELVTGWLAKYKFKFWEMHSSTGLPVTEEEKTARAQQIAKDLCDHSRWKTHGRSIKIDDLRDMRLVITDYSEMPELADAIRRYHVLLQMSFQGSPYKIFETPDSQIGRHIVRTEAPVPVPGPAEADFGELEVRCANCNTRSRIQVNLKPGIPLQPGIKPFPSDNKFQCPKCGAEHDLTDVRRQIEQRAGKPIVT